MKKLSEKFVNSLLKKLNQAEEKKNSKAVDYWKRFLKLFEKRGTK